MPLERLQVVALPGPIVPDTRHLGEAAGVRHVQIQRLHKVDGVRVQTRGGEIGGIRQVQRLPLRYGRQHGQRQVHAGRIGHRRGHRDHAGDLAESDRLREELAAKGVQLKDGKGANGEAVTTWEVKR